MKNPALTGMFAIMLASGAASFAQIPQGTAFSYQGQLRNSGVAVDAEADFEFTLWDSASGGTQVAGPIAVGSVDLVDGVFIVDLDFGATVWNNEARWLEIAVRSPAGSGSFTTLAPRQPLSATPYALQTRGIFVDSAENVGIGTNTPQHRLSVGGPTSDIQTILARFFSDTGQFWKGGAAFGGSSGSVLIGELDGVGAIGGHNGALSNWTDLSLNRHGGNVAIGSSDYSERLTVNGTIKSLTGGFVFPDGTTQTTAALSGGGSEWMMAAGGIFYDAGNVSIGTTDANKPFRVAGEDVAPIAIDLNFENGTPTVTAIEQEFVPTVDGYLTAVSFRVQSQSQGAPSQVAVEVRSGAHGQAGTTLAQSPLLAGADVGPRTIQLAEPPLLEAGQTYRLFFTTNGLTDLYTQGFDAYPAGGTWSNGVLLPDDATFTTFMAATTGSLADHLVVDELGRVGIGTAEPQRKLDVAGDLGAASIAAGTMSTNTLFINGGSDIAEPYDIAAAGDVAPLPGMVVSIDALRIGKLRVASAAYDATVAGIISGAGGVNPGLTLTQNGSVASGDHPVAMTGRVWCWVDADAGGAVKAGDLLTTSDTPGHAMKVSDVSRSHGAKIGKAMSALESGKGLVLVLVSLQ